MVPDVEVLEDELAGWMVWPEEPMHENELARRVVGVIAFPGDPVNPLGTLLYSLGATCYTAAFVRGATGHRSLVWGALGVLCVWLSTCFEGGAEARPSMLRFLIDNGLIALGAVMCGSWLGRRLSFRTHDADRP